jgi:hypothetical protein
MLRWPQRADQQQIQRGNDSGGDDRRLAQYG